VSITLTLTGFVHEVTFAHQLSMDLKLSQNCCRDNRQSQW